MNVALETAKTCLRFLRRMRSDAAEDRRRGLSEPPARLRLEFGLIESYGDGVVGKRRDSTHGTPTPYARLEKVANLLKPLPADVFLDLGCGSGRALAVLKADGGCRCVGVELAKNALALARANGFEVHEADAGSPPPDVLDAATLFYVGDAFGADTLDDFLNALQASLARSKRRVRLAYHEPVHRACFEERHWLVEEPGLPDEHIALWRAEML